jgi:hypothetical protein
MLSAYQITETHHGDMTLPVHERIDDLHRRAGRLAPAVEEGAADSGCTDQTKASYGKLGPRQRKAWDMVAEALSWNALTDRDSEAQARLVQAEEYERAGISYRIADLGSSTMWLEVLTPAERNPGPVRSEYVQIIDHLCAPVQEGGHGLVREHVTRAGHDTASARRLHRIARKGCTWTAKPGPAANVDSNPRPFSGGQPRCTTCQRANHAPGTWDGHYFTTGTPADDDFSAVAKPAPAAETGEPVSALVRNTRAAWDAHVDDPDRMYLVLTRDGERFEDEATGEIEWTLRDASAIAYAIGGTTEQID